MNVYEVIPGIYKFISEVSFFKTYSTGYFIKQLNETGYFCGMTLEILISCGHGALRDFHVIFHL